LRVALHPFDLLLLAAPGAFAAACLHWGAAVLFSRRPAPIRDHKHADEETITVPVHEEDFIVGKQEEEQGRVRLHKEVVQEHETARVSLEREHDIEVPVMGEEVAVGKQTRATKEVRVRKERVTMEATGDELRVALFRAAI
jgi:stress response protein YsnF